MQPCLLISMKHRRHNLKNEAIAEIAILIASADAANGGVRHATYQLSLAAALPAVGYTGLIAPPVLKLVRFQAGTNATVFILQPSLLALRNWRLLERVIGFDRKCPKKSRWKFIDFWRKLEKPKDFGSPLKRDCCINIIHCHASEGWHPVVEPLSWMPAFAGMTMRSCFFIALKRRKIEQNTFYLPRKYTIISSLF